MIVNKGDKFVSNKNCPIGQEGDVWTVDCVKGDSITMSCGKSSHVSMSANLFDRYFYTPNDVFRDDTPDILKDMALKDMDEALSRYFKNHTDSTPSSTIPVEKNASNVAPNKVSAERIDWLIEQSDITVDTVWDKCTIVSCRLPNGFVINEFSACVDPENYDEELGYKICMKRIEDKIWELEGYLLAEKRNGDFYDNDNCDEDWFDCLDDCCFR